MQTLRKTSVIFLRTARRPACQAPGNFMDMGHWGVLWGAMSTLTTGLLPVERSQGIAWGAAVLASGWVSRDSFTPSPPPPTASCPLSPLWSFARQPGLVLREGGSACPPLPQLGPRGGRRGGEAGSRPSPACCGLRCSPPYPSPWCHCN